MSGLRELAAQATPGPWVVDRNLSNRALRADNGHFTRLAVFDLHQDTPFEVDGVANARLAALAPEMAALLTAWDDRWREVELTASGEGDVALVAFARARRAELDALDQKAAQ